jgi:hypothetical protein
MTFRRFGLMFFYLTIFNFSIAQSSRTLSSISSSYNQVFYNFSEYYKTKYNAGFGLLYSENYKKFRFSIGFNFSSKRYLTSEKTESLPSFYKQFSIPVYGFPVSLTYFIFNDSKNHFGLNFGLSMNKTRNYKYVEFNEEFEVVKKYYSESGLGFSTSFGFLYRYFANDNLCVIFSPMVSLTQKSENESSIKTSPLFESPISKPTIFFNIGLEYFFKKSFVSQLLNQNKPPSL